MEEAEVVSANPFPAYEQTAEAVVPGVGAFHHPAAGLALDASQQGLLTPTPDMWRDSTNSNSRLSVLVVVSLVEAKVLGTARATRRAEDDRVERLADEPLVVDVGPGDLSSQRDPSAIGQDVPFDATFRTIRGVRAREVPPFGAFTMALSSEDHFHWMPRLRS